MIFVDKYQNVRAENNENVYAYEDPGVPDVWVITYEKAFDAYSSAFNNCWFIAMSDVHSLQCCEAGIAPCMD